MLLWAKSFKTTPSGATSTQNRSSAHNSSVNWKTALRQRGVSRFPDRGSTATTLYRTWARLKSRFVGGDHTLLVTAEQGEDAVTDIYSKAMEVCLPTAIRQILTSQGVHIMLAHNYVKAARGRAAACGCASHAGPGC